MPHKRYSQENDAQQDMMRCVVDGAGELMFVSPALGWSLGQNAALLIGKPLKSVIEIVNARGPVESGTYEVALLRQMRDPLLLKARIDRIDAPNGKTFTVIWCDPENKLKDQKSDDIRKAAHDFAVYVGDNGQSAAPRAPAVNRITETDGELRHFLNLTNDLFAVYAPDMRCMRFNPAFNRTLGLSDAAIKARAFIELIHPDDRDAALLAMKNVLAAREDEEVHAEFESRVLTDDSFCRIDWIVKAAGGHLYVVGRDITGLRRHEEELQRRAQQLSEAQKIGHMGSWRWDTDNGAMTDTMEWSDQVYTIFGVEKGAFDPSPGNVRAMIMKRDIARVTRALQRALVRKKDYAFEFRLRRPGGTVRYVRCEGRCRVSPRTGAVESFFGIIQDITERTLHEKALRAAKEAAEQAYATKTRFLANMSHELRTPLNAIIGFSEMIQRQLLGPVGNPRYLDYVGSIRESGDHLLDLINDILDMSKIEVGKYELHVEELNVGKAIRLAVHMLEGRAHEGQVRLITDGIEEDIQIRADRRALMQILLNILSNAVKFTRAGGSVDIRCQRELGGVAIVIADTGIGIPPEKLQIVTKPFEQVDSEFTRRYEGSGLGLAITKDLVELHGGTLDIDSEVGSGTVVSVLLPEKATG